MSYSNRHHAAPEAGGPAVPGGGITGPVAFERRTTDSDSPDPVSR